MANNYTLFSFAIPSVTKEEAAWVEKIRDTDPNILEELGLQELNSLDILIMNENDSKNRYVWIYAEENGDVEAAARFVQHFLLTWRADDPGIRFSWAETCDQPRIDNFGGGHALVTATEIRMCTGDCFDRR